MNYLNKNTPEGTRDLLYSEAELYDDLTRLFSKNYEMSGFRKVETPVIENYDLITAIDRSINQENLYKLTDNTGHLLALRPDNTTPIARIAATKLRNAELPQKLYYNQNIYRINTDYSGKRNEILQSGIELIGESGLKADLLCIMTALEALKSLGLKCKLEIGHVGFFNALLKELDLDDEEAATVRNFVEMKNFVSLNMFDKNLQNEKIRKLPLLYGGNEVFEEAAELASGNRDANDALDYVKKVYDLLDSAGYAEKIMVDMGIVHKFDYYTGIVFRGYIEGAGEPVLKGGRYDNLISAFGYDLPATGFAINVCVVADAIMKQRGFRKKESSKVIVHYDENTFRTAIKIKEEFMRENISCELSCFETSEEMNKYAEKMNISRVIDLTSGDAGRCAK